MKTDGDRKESRRKKVNDKEAKKVGQLRKKKVLFMDSCTENELGNFRSRRMWREKIHQTRNWYKLK